ncbi:hypothetical protein CASFOL_039067 [Castilleja foliolosa]|uniref:Uncharacterized protein n=1 Tax=Castilleja foliolosa TaxID=1961234 RepID=A0ABD3BGX8_9LAMI
MGVEGLNGRFMFLKNGLEEFVGKQVSSCSSVDSTWKNSQDGLLLNSRCVLYKSMSEEVSIWGWPLQTSGLLTAEHSFDRSAFYLDECHSQRPQVPNNNHYPS